MFFRRPRNPHAPLIASIGLNKGDRVAHLGCSDPASLAAISNHVGPGNVVAMVPDNDSAERARTATSAGAVFDVRVVSLIRLREQSGAFDVVVVDDTEDLIESIRPERRRTALGEIHRLLRAGGRVVVVSRRPRGGTIGAVLARVSRPLVDDVKAWLADEGFVSVRRRVAPGELVLTEGLKPSAQAP